MISLFTNPADTDLIQFIERSIEMGVPGEELKVYDMTLDDAVHAREFAGEIVTSHASIIDGDQWQMIDYAMEVGSVAGAVAWIAGGNWDWHRNEDLRARVETMDSRIMFIGRDKGQLRRLNSQFGRYYSVVSLIGGLTDNLAAKLGVWLRETVQSASPRVFISYRSSQRHFARSLEEALRSRGASVWFDEIAVRPGDSIPGSIDRGLNWCTHMVLVVDESFFRSKWTSAEYEAGLYRQLSAGRRFGSEGRSEVVVVPLFLVDPSSMDLPPMLARIRGIDCREMSAAKAVEQLWPAIAVTGRR